MKARNNLKAIRLDREYSNKSRHEKIEQRLSAARKNKKAQSAERGASKTP